MLSGIVILFGCLLLFVYWFRYVSMLILNQHDRQKAEAFALLSGLSFPQVEALLQANPRTNELDHLYDCLEADYRLLSPMLRGVRNPEAADYGILTDLLRQSLDGSRMTRRLIAVDFQVMRVWYKVNRLRHSQRHAVQALREMRSIIAYFAGSVGCGIAI